MRAFLAFCLIAAVLQPAAAADKMKIQIVSSESKMYMIDVTIPGTPEQTDLHCRRDALGNSVDCKSTTKAATQERQGQRPHFTFSANAIFPDGSHALLACIGGYDKECAGISPIAPEKTALPTCENVGEVETCTQQNLGFYEIKRDKSDIVIYGPKGKLKYHIIGSW
jgi:hypothetical protein